MTATPCFHDMILGDRVYAPARQKAWYVGIHKTNNDDDDDDDDDDDVVVVVVDDDDDDIYICKNENNIFENNLNIYIYGNIYALKMKIQIMYRNMYIVICR